MRQLIILMAGTIWFSAIPANVSASLIETHKVEINAESRKAAFRHAVQIWQNGRANLITELVTVDYIGHTSSGDRNADGLRERIADFHRMYPDLRFTIADQVAEGNRVVTRMTAVGTSSATGQRVKLIGLNISRFVGNRIAEEWPVWETLR